MLMQASSPLRTILFLVANPKDTGRLRLDEEVRNIQEGLKLSPGRAVIRFHTQWATRIQDLRRSLLEHQPHIIHFSGHGAGTEGLVLEDETGHAAMVPSETLARLCKLCPSVQCVVLNACYSQVQAEAIAEHVPYIIGMTDAIDDTAAIKFAVGFYDAVGYGRSIPDAYEFGITAIGAAPLIVRRDIAEHPEAAPMTAPMTPILICSGVRRWRRPPTLPPQVYRHRQVLLNKVRNFWIKGVLEAAIPHRAWLELDLKACPEAIAPLWETMQEFPEGAPALPLKGQRAIAVFDELGTGRTLLILGAPGAGKTTTLLELTRDLLARAEQDVAHPMPVVFNLSSWSVKFSLAQWLTQELSNKYQVTTSLGNTWIQEQQLLLLLDGLDEVTPEQREACIQAINQFHQTFGETEIVVCSRLEDYQALTYQLTFQAAIALQPLTPSQVEQYLAQAGPGMTTVRQALQTDEALQVLVRSPLMLSILTLAYQDIALASLPQQDLESRRHHLFETYVQRMLHRRGADPRYPQTHTRHWLTCLARQMSQRRETVFLIERMQPDWLTTPLQQGLYAAGVGLGWGVIWGAISLILSFSQQENFWAAVPAGINTWSLFTVYLSSILFVELVSPNWLPSSGIKRQGITIMTQLFLGAFTGALSGAIIGTLKFWASANASVIGWELTSAIFWGILLGTIWGIIWGSWHLEGNQIQPIEKLAWTWQKIWPGLVWWLLGGAVLGIGFGGVLETLIGLDLLILPKQADYVQGERFWTCVWGGIIWNLVWQLTIALKGPNIEKTNRPNQGILQATLNTLIFATLFGGILGLIALILEGKQAFLLGGLLGALLGSTLPVLSCIQHLVLRTILYWRHICPWHYSRFLDYAVERLFLQKVGGGYIFVHRLLLEHFAQPTSSSHSGSSKLN